MYLRIIFLITLLLIILPTNSLAISGVYEDCYYETGDRISVYVSGQVSKDKDKGIFSYSYTVKSSPQSEQNVWVFDIILPEKEIISGTGSPTGWKEPGWSGKPRKYSQKYDLPYSIGWTTPIGKDIKPSETVSGFMFQTSFGLPGIVDYYAEGDVPLPKCPEGMAVDFIPGYDDLTPYGPGIIGKTIGPTAPPTDFNPISFIDYIINIKHEAFSLGWITNKGIEQSLDVKLDNAKKKLEDGNNTPAKNILNAFLNEIEAQSCKNYADCPEGKRLTPEAYALLKYNVEYLINNLR
ncbi:MAG: hypothetical protein AB1610_10450 [Nitrospirota bacterium]